ncbi:ABC transporter permease [Liquorilactobacillus capillatus]|uniref:Protein ecsB n=1 Tax=Liquorilactobacillus capillatus DSM 19910 TaxID=1423731 RepID=A0A0R1MDI3_9LACO|nr:ABC transporter permease [Liquorilactobacillus capillatus]KRL03186.1 protein ecsB [Liquorilactobacillus capillatus DSM 19910]
MNDLWSVRLKKYQQILLRYSKFVLNDHFVLALLFFTGGLGLGYSNFLKSLPSTIVWWSRPLIVIILVLVLQLGSLVSLLEKPDTVFLLPLENKMFFFLKYAFRYSFSAGVIIQSLCFLVAVPFLGRGIHLTIIEIFLLWLTQLLLKALYLERLLLSGYNDYFDRWWIKLLFEFIGPLVVLLVAVYLSGWVALLVVFSTLIVVHWQLRKAVVHYVFRWNRMLQLEDHRLRSLYRFINLFTDVPQIKGKVYRFKLLDTYLPQIKTPKNIFKFLYWRSLVRKGEYSSLYLRLTLLGCTILMFISNSILALLLTALFLYLIGFQLFPLYHDYDDIVFMHIYPLQEGKQLINFRQVLRTLLVITSIFLFGASIIAGHSIVELLEIAGIIILMIVFLTGNFLTKRAVKNT